MSLRRALLWTLFLGGAISWGPQLLNFPGVAFAQDASSGAEAPGRAAGAMESLAAGAENLVTAGDSLAAVGDSLDAALDSLAASAAPPPPAGPAPPSNLMAADHPWDGGDEVDLSWTLSPEDSQVEVYQIYRATAAEGPWELADLVPAGTSAHTVTNLSHESSYFFRVVALGQNGAFSEEARTAAAFRPTREWFDGSRLALFIIALIFCGAVIYWIEHARRGRPLNVRKIAGLQAVDEAVGRATELGRSCVYVPGIQDMNEIQTIASMTILARVAGTAAEYDAKVEVPTSKSLVMTTARETVHAAFMAAGRPDAYNEDLIYYVTDEQFGYVAYLSGMMVREKPAACFYMGSFFAESLILAETGNSIGAIQVAGTAQPAQLPFFVAACDYTLIGEEFFAASAYLSGSPEELGSLKGQDVGKVVVAVILVIGVALATAAAITGSTGLAEAVDFLRESVLT